MEWRGEKLVLLHRMSVIFARQIKLTHMVPLFCFYSLFCRCEELFVLKIVLLIRKIICLFSFKSKFACSFIIFYHDNAGKDGK